MLLEDLLEQEKREQQQNATPMQGPVPTSMPQATNSTPMQMPPQQQQAQPNQQQQQQQPQQQPQQPQQVQQMPVQMQNPNQNIQQMPGQNIGQPLPVGAVLQQVRPQGPPPGAAFPGGVVQRPMMIQQQQGQMMPGQPQGPQQWQIRHPQEVTLQQRGPMGPQGPPHQVMGMHGGPPRMPMDQHPALMRQDPTPPPPPALDSKPMTPPPENPQTEEERAHVVRYEQWLSRQEAAINQHLKYYETEISKLRKQRKVRHIRTCLLYIGSTY